MPIDLHPMPIMIYEMNNLVRQLQEQFQILFGRLQATQASCSEIAAKSVGFSQILQRLENLSTALRAECSKRAMEEQSSISTTSMPNGEMKGSASLTDGKLDPHYVPVSTPNDPEGVKGAISSTPASRETNGLKSRRRSTRDALSSVAKLRTGNIFKKKRRRKSTVTTTR